MHYLMHFVKDNHRHICTDHAVKLKVIFWFFYPYAHDCVYLYIYVRITHDFHWQQQSHWSLHSLYLFNTSQMSASDLAWVLIHVHVSSLPKTKMKSVFKETTQKTCSWKRKQTYINCKRHWVKKKAHQSYYKTELKTPTFSFLDC